MEHWVLRPISYNKVIGCSRFVEQYQSRSLNSLLLDVAHAYSSWKIRRPRYDNERVERSQWGIFPFTKEDKAKHGLAMAIFEASAQHWHARQRMVQLKAPGERRTPPPRAPTFGMS